jgi:murein DD-endopeptidase MepM/ murein hydrolase activator NlpD
VLVPLAVAGVLVFGLAAPASAGPLPPLPLPTLLPLPLPTLLPLPLPTLPPLLPRPPAPVPTPAPAPAPAPLPNQPPPAPPAQPRAGGTTPGSPGTTAPGQPGPTPTAPDFYPELPFDPITTPSAARVQALYTALKRIQALQNELATGTTRLATERKALAAAESVVADAAARRDEGGRELFMTPTRPGTTTLTVLGVDPTDLRIKDIDRAVRELEVAQSSADRARGQVTRTTVALAVARRELATQQAAAGALRAPVAALSVVNTGRLLRPVDGPLTSPFGTRYDPYYHVWQLHAGLDLAAAAGTPIRAAAGGTVVRAGWFGGYGNYTCLAHGVVDGQRLMTCYGHQSQLLVRPGQQVSAGQVIGRVGTTGASTGPHLHFEVRLGGRPVDPRPWL